MTIPCVILDTLLSEYLDLISGCNTHRLLDGIESDGIIEFGMLVIFPEGKHLGSTETFELEFSVIHIGV